MIEIKYENNGLVIDNFIFNVKPKIIGFYYDEENYFIIQDLLEQIYKSSIFISHLYNKYPKTTRSIMDIFMFLKPHIAKYYCTENYPLDKVLKDIDSIIVNDIFYLFTKENEKV